MFPLLPRPTPQALLSSPPPPPSPLPISALRSAHRLHTARPVLICRLHAARVAVFFCVSFSLARRVFSFDPSRSPFPLSLASRVVSRSLTAAALCVVSRAFAAARRDRSKLSVQFPGLHCLKSVLACASEAGQRSDRGRGVGLCALRAAASINPLFGEARRSQERRLGGSVRPELSQDSSFFVFPCRRPVRTYVCDRPRGAAVWSGTPRLLVL